MSTSRPVGWEKDSYGYHGDDGRSFRIGAHNKAYGPAYGKANETIGCGINFTDSSIWFTKDGVDLGTPGPFYEHLGQKHLVHLQYY